MIEKVNIEHIDKVADRIGGAIVDLAYKKQENPKIALEIMIGHRKCFVITETSVHFELQEIQAIVDRMIKGYSIEYIETPQDIHLAKNQEGQIRCGDNGIFKAYPLTEEEKELSKIARDIYSQYPYDGKYILDDKKLIICQSNAVGNKLKEHYDALGYETIVNPLGDWTGSGDSDVGCGNRKLGSDMGKSVTGGGINLKDISKADVSVNIYCFLKAQELNKTITASCAIGDTEITFNVLDKEGKVENQFTKPYKEITKVAKDYIDSIGGFEKFAEWGLF